MKARLRERNSSLRRGGPIVSALTNPLPATGAAEPDTIESVRTYAPLTVATLGRIVSLFVALARDRRIVETLPSAGDDHERLTFALAAHA